MTHAPTTDGWRRSFTDQSLSQFAEQFADEIVLEATTLATPVKGKHSVAAVLAHRKLHLRVPRVHGRSAKRVDDVPAMACNGFRRHTDRRRHGSRA